MTHINNIPKETPRVIEGSGTKQLWIAGQIPYEVVLPSGDWRPYLPVGEKQRPNLVDVMACVTFSNLSSLEIQNIQKTGIEINYEDRFTAKMSGTTPEGNYLDRVADSVRLDGVVYQGTWPPPANFTWDSYYTPIPQEIKNKALKLNMAYEAIPVDKQSLLYHLKQCPIQVTIPAPHPNHAVVLVHIQGDTAYYFDSYSPFLKQIEVSKISYALKLVLIKTMFTIKKVKVNGAYGVLVDMPNNTAITKAEDETEWRSYSKADSYGVHTVNTDGTTDFSVDLEINY